jgi:hypothetical protein
MQIKAHSLARHLAATFFLASALVQECVGASSSSPYLLGLGMLFFAVHDITYTLHVNVFFLPLQGIGDVTG